MSRTKDGHFVRPAHALPQLGDAGRQRRPVRRRRLRGRGRPLSSLRLARLPLGAPHRHLPQAQGAGERHLDVGGLARHAQGRLDLQQERGLDRRRRSTARASCPKSICSPTRTIPAASACRCCGTKSARRSSTTSRPKSSACSIRRSTPSPMCTPTTIRQPLRAEIDRINDLVYPNINNGVYRAGFATTQAAYEQAFRNVFDALDEIEQILSQQRYLAGSADHRGRLAAVPHADPLRRGLLLRTSSATGGTSTNIRTCRIICATSIRCRAWPRP